MVQRIPRGTELVGAGGAMRIRFLETDEARDGGPLVTEWSVRRYTGNVEHWHPVMTETFEVLEGELEVVVDGVVRALRPGDVVVLPPGTRHRFAAAGAVRWRQTNAPALRHDLLFARDVARADRRGIDGAPGPLEALLLFQVMDGYLASGPPLPVQRALRAVLDLVHPVPRR